MMITNSAGLALKTIKFTSTGLCRKYFRYFATLFLLSIFSLFTFTAFAAEEKFSGASTQPDDYRIGPEDVLFISVWKEEELQREVLVRPDGGVSFPLAGDIQVAGKTPSEVEKEITTRVKKYIPEAVVTVSVNKVSGYTIFVSGKVRQPGKFVVGRYMDVLQAITLAGGLGTFADENGIHVLRRQNGKQVIHKFNYKDVKRGRNLDQNIILQSGDVVVVP